MNEEKYINLDDLFDEINSEDDFLYDKRIRIVYVWCPGAGQEMHYQYDEEYSFEGTKEDYQKFKKDYFEFDNIDPEYVSYGSNEYHGDVDVSILYLRDM